jgi:hypothetical protein|tara:strand:+ start:2470 stop:3420 length:951 start_codon:yes stop_codon:yes gene_type:complete
MPQPTSQDVHVDAILTQMSVAFMQDQNAFVASRVFPTISVNKQSDKYFVYSQADFFRDQVLPRADGTESAGTGYSLSTATYSATNYALHKDIGHLTMANADAPLDPMADATRFLSQQMLIKQERDWATNCFTTSVWDTDATPSTLWSASSSTPIADVETAKNTILSNTGYMANTMVMSYKVFSNLVDNDDITDRIKYTSSDSVTADLLARLFGLDRVLIMMSTFNSADEGATASYSQIGDRDALVCYVAPNAGLMMPSAGYNMVWSGAGGGLGTNTAISQFELPERRATRVEIESAWDYKVVSSALGYFLSNCVAS